jgi:hypothetical protein
MELVDDIPHVRVTLGSDNITITGDVNLVDTVTVNSTPEDPVHTHITEVGTSGVLAVPYMPIQGTVTVNQPVAVTDNNGSLTVDGTVSLSANTLSALENINATVSGSVSVGNFPATQAVTGTFWQATQPVSGTLTIQDGGNTITVDGTVTANVTFPTTQQVSGTVALDANTLSALENTTVTISGTPTVNIGTIPEIEIKNDTGNPIPITGSVTTTITDVITVVVNEDAGSLYAFNNHAANANRGWTMDNTMRPVISIRNGSASALDLIKIVEYEIGNNNANQSTIVYEWYEGPLTIAGAAIPAWTTFGVHSQYRVYQDQYSSNQGNTFTVPAGTYMRHSGIIIGKNTSGDEGPASMHGGATDADKNMLTLCMKRVDNATKLDVWFAFTIRELT